MAQDGLTGFTFDFGKVPSIADAHLYDELSLQDRVILGIDDELPVTSYGLELTIGRGEALVMGRMIKVTNPITLEVPSLFQGYLVAEVDLAQYNDHSGDIGKEDYRFTLNQATIKIVSTLTDTSSMHDAVIGTISATSTNINFTKDYNFYNPDLFRRSIVTIEDHNGAGFVNNFEIGSTNARADDHTHTMILPIAVNADTPLNIDDIPAYNFDAIADAGGFTGTLPVSSSNNFNRLEHRWTQTGSNNRIVQTMYVSETNNGEQGTYQRFHTGSTWGAWKRLANANDLANFVSWSTAKGYQLTTNYTQNPIYLTEQSGILSINYGGGLKNISGDGDVTIGTTVGLGISLPMYTIRGALGNASDGTPMGTFRWLSNGNIIINLNATGGAPADYFDFGGSGASQNQYAPLVNSNYNQSL